MGVSLLLFRNLTWEVVKILMQTGLMMVSICYWPKAELSFILLLCLCLWEVALADDSDTEEEIKEEEAIGDKEGAPSVSNGVEAKAVDKV